MDIFAEYFESLNFDAQINVVSGFNSFLKVLDNSPVFQLFLVELHNPFGITWTLARIHRLAGASYDPKYQHPQDTSLAVYIYGLCKINPAYAILIKNALEPHEKDLYYSIKILEAVYKEMNYHREII